MKTLPLSEIKMKLSQLIEEIVSQDEQITITRNEKPPVVLICLDEFDSWHETVTIRSDAQLMKERSAAACRASSEQGDFIPSRRCSGGRAEGTWGGKWHLANCERLKKSAP